MEPSHNPLAIEVFVQSLLHLGSKSFTHTFAGLAKYHSVFKVPSTVYLVSSSPPGHLVWVFTFSLSLSLSLCTVAVSLFKSVAVL